MGTRSLTHIIQKKNNVKTVLTTIYCQYDGYPSGVGIDLAKHLSQRSLVNGFGSSNQMSYNGAECLAAQIISHLKDGIGNVYIYPPKSKDCGEEYTYRITADEDNGEIIFECLDENFKGTADKFIQLYKD